MPLRSQVGVRKALVCIGDFMFRGQPPVITWCRIVGLFAVAAAIAREVVANGNPHLIPTIVTTFGELVDCYLAHWIYKQGGWVSVTTSQMYTQQITIGKSIESMKFAFSRNQRCQPTESHYVKTFDHPSRKKIEKNNCHLFRPLPLQTLCQYSKNNVDRRIDVFDLRRWMQRRLAINPHSRCRVFEIGQYRKHQLAVLSHHAAHAMNSKNPIVYSSRKAAQQNQNDPLSVSLHDIEDDVTCTERREFSKQGLYSVVIHWRLANSNSIACSRCQQPCDECVDYAAASTNCLTLVKPRDRVEQRCEYGVIKLPVSHRWR